jgi:signal transduction histidine kinase
MREVVNQVVEELAPLATSSDATVEVSIDDVQVACAPELLHVVVLNLVGNALKFMAGRPERRVVLRAIAEAGGTSFVVTDTGPGIPAEAIPHIFEPFFRVPGNTSPGTGIGLATVQRIVTAHGGRIHCSSTLGHGATFHVWLPNADPSEHAEGG